ncbi:MAG TPA: DNA-binding protein [Caldithrix sp.]|nr:DNA-binding protein [Caldithrix sp.]
MKTENQHIEWLTPDQFEQELGISKSTQAKLRMRKKIPFVKFGKFIYYDRREIDEHLQNHKIEVSHA